MKTPDDPMIPSNGPAQDLQVCQTKLTSKIDTRLVTDCWVELLAAAGACASVKTPASGATCGATIASVARCATREVEEEIEAEVEECSEVP